MTETLASLNALAARLTRRFPPGTPCRCWTGTYRHGPGHAGLVRSWSVLSGHTVVGWVDGVVGCVAATHVEVGGAGVLTTLESEEIA